MKKCDALYVWELAKVLTPRDVCLFDCSALDARAMFAHIYAFVRRVGVNTPVVVHCASAKHAQRLNNSARAQRDLEVHLDGRCVRLKRAADKVRTKRDAWVELLNCADETHFRARLQALDPANYPHVKRLSVEQLKEMYFPKLYTRKETKRR